MSQGLNPVVVPPPAIQITRNWVERVLTGLSFSSPSHHEMIQNRIHYCIMDDDLDAAMTSLIAECERLDNDRGTENSLLIFPDNMQHFYSFQLVAEMAWERLTEQGYSQRYQLELLHPNYRFSDSKPDNPDNYTNRSPYPTFHLIRKTILDGALLGFPERNGQSKKKNRNQKARDRGVAQLRCLVGGDGQAA